ncbi:MAG: cell division protein ZapA [Rhodobacteraceae bacterium]|nr:cell division protein ZapA [Paracoccaceae bacterium]
MAEIDLEINGRPHRVGCGEGEEIRLRALAKIVDTHARGLALQMGVFSDAKLFLMTALTIADELADAQDRIATLEAAAPPFASTATSNVMANGREADGLAAAASDLERETAEIETPAAPPHWPDPEVEEAFAELLSQAAERLIVIADRIEAA